MITLDIPGFGQLELVHVVLDYNGTVAQDGELLPEVGSRLQALSENLEVTVLTADTHGTVRQKLADLPVQVVVLPGSAAPTFPG